MSYKNQSHDVQASTSYDYVNLHGPATYKEIDSMFQEYCKLYSSKDKTSVNGLRRLTSSHLAKSFSAGTPTAKNSESTKRLGATKKAWDAITPSYVNQDVQTRQRSELEDKIVRKLGSITNKGGNMASLQEDEEITQLISEYGISLEVLSSLQTSQEKRQYIAERMRKRVNDELKEFNKKHYIRVSHSNKFEEEYQKNKEKVKNESADIYKWLRINTPHGPLKKKLRSTLAEAIHDHENQSIIEASLLELKNSGEESTLLNASRNIRLENIPIVDNLEILQGMIKNQNDNLFKLTKSMKHARRKKLNMHPSSAGNSFSVDPRMNNSATPKEGIRMNISATPKDANRINFSATPKDANETNIQANETMEWDSHKEQVFRFYREDAKSRLFNMIKSSNCNGLGFSPLIQAAQKDEKSMQQREAKLANYMNGDLLTPDEYKLIANTSTTLNKFVDKNYMQTVVNHLDPDVIEAFETDLAETTMKDYQKRQEDLKGPRLDFLKEHNKELAEKIEKADAAYQRHIKILQGAEEQRKIKKKALNFLTRVDKSKSKKNQSIDIVRGSVLAQELAINQHNFDGGSPKAVNRSALLKKSNSNSKDFLKRLLPFRRQPSLPTGLGFKHSFHPPSKLVVESSPMNNKTKDFLGLGLNAMDSSLVARKNETPEEYKLHIHNPPNLTISSNFKKFYSGGPSNEDDAIFQGTFIVGDVSKYKTSKLKEKLVLRLQAVWRGHKQRKAYKELKERAKEYNNNNKYKHFKYLKVNTKANPVKAVFFKNNDDKANQLKNSDTTNLRKLRNKTVDTANPVNQPSLTSIAGKKLDTDHSTTPKSYHGSRALITNDNERARNTSIRIMSAHNPGESRGSFIRISGLNTVKSNQSIQNINIGAIEDTALERNDEIIENYQAHEQDTSCSIRPNTAIIDTRVAFSPTNARKRARKQASFNKQGSFTNHVEVNARLDLSPDDMRMQKIVGRAAPKGLLLKQRKLFSAARANNFHIIQISGFNYYPNDVNTKDDSGNTPLYYAAKHGNKEICEFLVRHGADVNERCTDGNTPLHMAFASNKTMAVITLLSGGGDLNVLNDNKQTPVAFGNESLLTLLDLREAIATYTGRAFAIRLPPGYDNNRFLVRFQKKQSTDNDQLEFKYNSLEKPHGNVRLQNKEFL